MVSLLCQGRLGVKSYTHIVEPGFIVPSDKEAVLEDDLKRLLRSEPLQYVLGEAEFFGRRFKVSPAVLIPRPETELLIEEVITSLAALPLTCPRVDTPPAPDCLSEQPKILDLCTGSGCIAWTLAAEIEGAEVTAVDISPEALEVAASQSIECTRPPRFVRADVLGGLPEEIRGKYDIIVSNPPYVMDSQRTEMRSNVLDYEPSLALFVPDSDPLVFYRAIARHAIELLRPGGLGIVEINDSLGEDTAAVFSGAGFSDVRLISDLYGRKRFVYFRL